MFGIFYINLTAFSQQKPSLILSKHDTITQTDLQNVLGTSISIGNPEKKISEDLNDPINKYWINTTNEKLNFRDGYVILAINAFNKRDCLHTKYYLDKAYALDPNNSSLKSLLPHIQNCLNKEP
jgi:hypothetical protein